MAPSLGVSVPDHQVRCVHSFVAPKHRPLRRSLIDSAEPLLQTRGVLFFCCPLRARDIELTRAHIVAGVALLHRVLGALETIRLPADRVQYARACAAMLPHAIEASKQAFAQLGKAVKALAE